MKYFHFLFYLFKPFIYKDLLEKLYKSIMPNIPFLAYQKIRQYVYYIILNMQKYFLKAFIIY